MREAITGHSEAVIRGSSMVSGRQSSEVRQWSPGGSHQRFVNGLREARLSRECLELLLLLAQHARLLGGLGARSLGVELQGGQPALEILELLRGRLRLLLRRRPLEVECIAPVGKRGGRRAERVHAGGRRAERMQGACKGKGSSLSAVLSACMQGEGLELASRSHRQRASRNSWAVEAALA